MTRRERIFSIARFTKLAIIPTSLLLATGVYSQANSNQNESPQVAITIPSSSRHRSNDLL
jgi:hypothetical protein